MDAAYDMPDFLRGLAARARQGQDVLVDRDAETRTAARSSARVRSSAVLVLVAGFDLGEAQVALEERGHGLRSQPGQFSLPGGGADPGDRDDVHTALREAQEETGLDPEEVSVLGSFAAIPMPWLARRVTPVLAWCRRRPALRAADPIEVERVVWAPLTGPGSLTDPARQQRGVIDGSPVGPVFDLPGDAFVWGLTGMILEQMLMGLGLDPVAWDAPLREIPPERRR